jgi:hypothetical protein
MNKSASPPPSDASSRLARLFDSAKFRRRALKVYRVAGPVVLAYLGMTMLQSAGLVGRLSPDNAPQWLVLLYALVTYGIALLTPILFVLSSVGAVALKSDWRFATPLWLFSAASGLFLVTVFMAGSLSLADQRQVWTVANILLLASAAWATVEGYRPGKPTS